MGFSKALACAALMGVAFAGSAEAENLRRSLVPASLNNPILEGAIAPLANAIGSQVANQIPTLSTSAGYTYEWNPELEGFSSADLDGAAEMSARGERAAEDAMAAIQAPAPER